MDSFTEDEDPQWRSLNDPDEPVPSRGGLGNVVLGMMIMGAVFAAVICVGGFVVGWW